MNTRVSLFLVFLALIPISAIAEGDMDPAVMQEVMALAQPGEEHELLAKTAGSWTMAIKMYMMPGAPAMEAVGQIEAEMALGGRFLIQRSLGTFMGEPFEGITILGFDRRHGVHTLVGYDTMGTYYITAQGTLQDDGTLVLAGHDDNPPLGSQDYEFHMRFPSENEMVTELYMSVAGSEMSKLVEWTATRN